MQLERCLVAPSADFFTGIGRLWQTKVSHTRLGTYHNQKPPPELRGFR
jgi:hypothetical protein